MGHGREGRRETVATLGDGFVEHEAGLPSGLGVAIGPAH